MTNKKVGIIGCGNMGQAIIQGIVSSGLIQRNRIFVTDAEKNKASLVKAKFKANIEQSNRQLVKNSDIIILAVKPQVMDLVLSEIKDEVTRDKLFISIAAGITTRYIEKKLGAQAKVIRIMPNTPALVKESMSLICRGRKAAAADLQTTEKIFNALGKTAVTREDLFDAITAIGGSGPAYYFYLSEILIDLAKEQGLNKDLAQKMVKQTLLGSAKLFNLSKDDAQTLRKKITSKGGITEAAFKVLKNKKVREIFEKAISSGVKRSKELSKK